jgi:tetratricopeptide (TPR) repeat protein
MKLLTTSAIALIAAASAGPALAQYESGGRTSPPVVEMKPRSEKESPAKGPQPSKGALKALSELLTAVHSKDPAAIQAKLPAAQAAVSTPQDRYLLARLQLEAAVDAKDMAAAANALDALLATGVAQPEEAASFYKNLSHIRFEAKQYDLAAAAVEKRLQLNPNDVDAIGLLAETRNSQGRVADAVAALQRGIQAQSAGGQKAPEAWLKRAAALAYNAKLPNAPEVARQWVAGYPSAISWNTSIGIFRNLTHPGLEGTIALMRLMAATSALTASEDYALYIQAAAQEGNWVEAKAALDMGIAGKHVDPASARFKDMVAEVNAKKIATEADLAVALASAPAAKAMIGIGDRYYALGNYGKAAETYRNALARPGVDANVANLYLGIALARSGDKAGATAALAKVGGALSEVAKYWQIYVQAAS